MLSLTNWNRASTLALSQDSGAEETDEFRLFGDVVHLRADNGVKRPDHLHALRVKALCEPLLLLLGVECGDQIVVDYSVQERVSADTLECVVSPGSERFPDGK